MHEEVWRAAGFDAVRRPRAGARRVRREVDRAGQELFADILDGHEVHGQQLALDHASRTVRNEQLARTATSSSSATPPTPPTSPSAPAPSSPWRTPSRSPPACTSSPTLDEALAAYEAERRPSSLSTQRAAAGQPGVVREPRPVRPPGPGAVRLQHPDPQPPRHPRQPAAARPRVRRRRRRSGSPPQAAGGAPPTSAADVPAVPAAAGSSCANRVVVSPMDMYVAGRRHARRLPPRPPRRQGARRRRAGDDRDGLRLARRAGSRPAAPASTTTSRQHGLARGSPTSCTPAAPAKIGMQLGHSGRKGSTKLMWEGIDEPLDRRQLAGRRAVAAALPAGRQPGAARADARPTWRRSRPSSSPPPGAPTPPGSTCSSCTARTATCSPSFLSPLTNRAHRRATAAPSTNRLRYPLEVFDAMRAVWPAHKPMTVRISATDWVEGGIDADDAVEIARAFADARRRRHRRLHRPGHPRRAPAFGRSYQTPVRRPRSATGSASRPSPSGSSRPGTTSTRSSWPGAPTSAPSAAPTSTTPAGRCTPPPSRTTTVPGAQWPMPVARRPPQAAGRPHRRTQAAPAAGPRGRRRHPSRQVAPA